MNTVLKEAIISYRYIKLYNDDKVCAKIMSSMKFWAER